MAANLRAVDHVLPIVCQTLFDRRSQDHLLATSLGPTTKPHIDGVSQAVPLMHIAPWAAGKQHMQYAVEERQVVTGGTIFAAAFRW
ncbi:hypothetical protein EDF58_1223 [Novosphingobium sp. PhB57]|nr:hypothetical protein EDF58_1223 [Novosphingobium sp. PhB57]